MVRGRDLCESCRQLAVRVYRAVDQYRQVIDVYVSPQRDTRAARRFFTSALVAHGAPVEVVGRYELGRDDRSNRRVASR